MVNVSLLRQPLFERAAQPGEGLPAGAPRTVRGLPAVLQPHDNMHKLTWIDAGTWIEIESNLSETELQKIAEGLVPLQPTTVTASQPTAPRGGNPRHATFAASFCDPAQAPPQGVMLGSVAGQQHQGSLWVEFFPSDGQPDGLALGLNVPDQRSVIAAALRALRDPATPMQRLPYQSISSFQSDGLDGCMVPNPKVQGYVVIEVWNGQVNLGYGGNGAEQKARAVKVLEQALEDKH